MEINDQILIDELLQLLNSKYHNYCSSGFIETDPIQIPHLFDTPEDIEIAGFFAATLAWGSRPQIIKCARRLMQLMDDAPADFVRNASPSELKRLEGFVYRTFNGVDAVSFVLSLREILKNHQSLGNFFQQQYQQTNDIYRVLNAFRAQFFSSEAASRSYKHLANVASGSSGKRLNMFLRWMVRHDKYEIDFGLWREIPMSALYLPLDVHSGNTARQLGLLMRKQNDWKAVDEVTSVLRTLDADDPVRFDFALFGLGAFEKKK
jgi:uncharacterized protein (TIGR02757 family)